MRFIYDREKIEFEFSQWKDYEREKKNLGDHVQYSHGKNLRSCRELVVASKQYKNLYKNNDNLLQLSCAVRC